METNTLIFVALCCGVYFLYERELTSKTCSSFFIKLICFIAAVTTADSIIWFSTHIRNI